MSFKRVCIIDDDSIFIYTSRRILDATKNCESFSIYKNGVEAIEKLSEIHKTGEMMPDLILLDITMPGKNGWEFIEEMDSILREHNITVLLVSSSKRRIDIQRAKEYDIIKGYCVKPLTFDTLQIIMDKEQLNEYLHKKKKYVINK